MHHRSERDGEFHGRLARTVLPLLLPLLALPLGMAAKRGRRAPGTVFAALALLALNQALQFGESLGETGRAPAWLAVWLPVVFFGVLGIWLFRSSLQWPGDNPVMRAVQCHRGRHSTACTCTGRRQQNERGAGQLPARRVTGQIIGLLLALTGLMQLLELLEVTNDVLDRNLGIAGVLHYAVLQDSLAAAGGAAAGRACWVRWRPSMRWRVPARSPRCARPESGCRGCWCTCCRCPSCSRRCTSAWRRNWCRWPRKRLKTWWDSTLPLEKRDADSRWVRTSGGILLFERSSADGKRLLDVRIYSRGPDGLLTLTIRADEARWQRGQLAPARRADLRTAPGNWAAGPGRAHLAIRTSARTT